MKIRKGFVSNSSSSSFIVTDKKVLDEYFQGIKYKELDDNEKERLSNQGFPVITEKFVALTEFVTDCIDWPWTIGYDKCIKNVYSYDDGNHGGPYNEDLYDEIDESIWIICEDISNENT